jgi:hypothetical protein
VVCTYLLWLAPNNAALAYPTSLSIGLVNLAGAVLIIGWILSGSLGIGALGTAVLLIAALILLFFGSVELRYACRRRFE